MLKTKTTIRSVLRLGVGELVEIRSREEILRTLDGRGTLDAIPFMPEMLKFAGKRYRVFKRVDKVCGSFEAKGFGFRRMENAVLLEGLRCDGGSHGGCQASCMILWKEAWLRRVSSRQAAKSDVDGTSLVPCESRCTETTLNEGTRKAVGPEDIGEETFICQATELKNGSSPLACWDMIQYLRDIRSGNVSVWQVVRGLLIAIFNAFQQFRNGVTYPYLPHGELRKTPGGTSDLRVGEIVEVKSKEEIWQTLNSRNRNRGLLFDVEMLKFCGRRFDVRGSVRKIIDGRTGKMLNFPNDCVVLEGVTCGGDYHQFCPMSEYIYWREIWLRKVT